MIETASSYGRGLLRGIAEYSRLYGPWSFFVEPGGVSDLRRWQAEGVIALVRSRRQALRLRAARLPLVDLDYALPELEPWGVSTDEPAIAGLAARHFLDRGLRRFAFVGWEREAFWERARREGFISAVGHAEVYRWPRAREWPREQRHLARWLAALPRPSGVFASNDERGRQVLEAARLARLRVPEDLAVLGVDDDEVLCELAVPSLSSIALDTRTIGYEGAALLDRLMSGRRPGRPVLVGPLGIVARRSTEVLAIDDPAVVSALQLLRRNVHRPLRVADLLRAAGVSRRTLEVRFREALGRTPHQELLRTRLERVSDLLVRTDWPLKRVASACGFTYAEQMHAAFRRALRTTPARFRRQHRPR